MSARRRRSGTPCVLLELAIGAPPWAGSPRRPRPSRRRRRRRRARAPPRASPRRSRPRSTSTPAGGRTVPGPSTSVTVGAASERLGGDGHAHLAARAVPDEADRIDRLVGRTRGDEHAATGQRSLDVGTHARRAAAATAAVERCPRGSLIRPMPSSPCASAPSTGPTNRTPRASERGRRCACVAGAAHMPACIAGAITSGPANSSSVADSRSSARPCASFAMRVRRWRARSRRGRRSCARRTCRTSPGDLPQRRVGRVAGERRRTCRRRRTVSRTPVRTAVTSAPARVSSRARKAALYAAMPPETPSSDPAATQARSRQSTSTISSGRS